MLSKYPKKTAILMINIVANLQQIKKKHILNIFGF
tara:strand:+ start:225 stop:329 length:105 start_codon:yes stop_codon:yes gene_type:complete